MKLKLQLLTLACALSAGALQAQVFPVSNITINGSKDNRINLVFLPDGYQSAQISTFKTNVTSIQTYLFNQPPYQQYAKFFNVYCIEVPSTDAGASHPGTATDVTEPASPVTAVNTYFNATFDNGAVHRAIYAKNSSGVFSVLNANFPDYDIPFVLANTTVYGGTGGSYITSTVNSAANEIAVHELGHTFGKLWDEYWNNMPGEHPNMTQNNSSSTIIWKNWLNPTPVLGIGIYAYGTTAPQSTWYRPHQNCKMQVLNAPLCAVCQENIIDRIYEKIRPIDVYTPDTVNTVASSSTAPTKFTFSPIRPNPNTLKYKWVLNGATINTTDTSVQINESQLNVGNNTLTAVITDTTLTSRSYLPGNGYMFSIQWKIKRDWATSITAISADNKFIYKLYPVPAKNVVNLYCNNTGIANSINYDITTIIGSIVKKGSITLAQGEQTIPLDIAGLVPGTYNLNLQGDGVDVNSKIIIE